MAMWQCVTALLCTAAVGAAAQSVNAPGSVLFSFDPRGQLQLVPSHMQPSAALVDSMPRTEGGGRPCVLTFGGMRMHAEQWADSNWKYGCANGTVKTIACIGSRRTNFAEIAINETAEANGFWHKCEQTGQTIRYTQEPSCVVQGLELKVNDTFRNGHFNMRCNHWGYDIVGCVYYDAEGQEQSLPVGESAVVGTIEHKCTKVDDKGRVKYSFRATACTVDGVVRQVNETWVKGHLRLRCNDNGAWGPIGCVLDDGSELSVGSHKVANNTVFKCYRIGATVYYHAYPCGLRGVPCTVAAATTASPAEGVDQNKVVAEAKGTGSVSSVNVLLPPQLMFGAPMTMSSFVVHSGFSGYQQRTIQRCFNAAPQLAVIGGRAKRAVAC